MTRARIAIAACLLLISSGAIAGPVAGVDGEPDAAERAAPACVDGWMQEPIADTASSSRPHALLTRNGKRTLLVGGSNAGPLAFRWRDGRWRRTDIPGDGSVGLMGGDLVRGSRAWTVGYDKSQAGRLTPLAGTLVKRRYRDEAFTDAPAKRTTLTDVAALDGDGALATGLWLDEGRMRAYAREWDGARWLRPRSPSPKGESGLAAVTATPSGALWAVGWQQAKAAGPRPLIAKRKSGRWRLSDGAVLGDGAAVLADVSLRDGRDVWAAGYHVPSGGSRHAPLLQHWDGSRWEQVDLPWATERSGLLRSVSVGAEDVWVAGTWLPDGDSEVQGFVAGLVDGEWRVHDRPSGPGARSDMWVVAALDDGAVAAAETERGIEVITTCEGSSTEGPGAGATALPADDVGAAAAFVPAPMRKKVRRLARGDRFVLRDMAGRVGLDERLETYRGLAADFDADGWTDVLYSRHFGPPALAMGGEDGFELASGGRFSDIDRHGCAAADIDADGRLDALCAVGRAKGRSIDRHDLVLAPAYDDAVIVRDAAGAEDPFGRGRGIVFLHLDDDEYPELFITTAPDRTDGLPGTNRFFRNVGGRFVPAPEVGLDRSTGGACALAADIDGDGDDDLLQCVEFPADGRAAGLRIFRNDDGVLRERSRKLGIDPMEDIDAVVADIDGDGRPDLAQLAEGRLRVSRGTPDGFRVIFDRRITDGAAIAAGDIDADGRDDLYVARSDRKGNRKHRLYRSRPRSADSRFEAVDLPRVGGKADDVIALDYDRNGHTDFLVLNGRGDNAGPVQLIASFPRGS